MLEANILVKFWNPSAESSDADAGEEFGSKSRVERG